MLLRKEISSMTSPETYQRGIKLTLQHKVGQMKIKPTDNGFKVSAPVTGYYRDSYPVTLLLEYDEGSDDNLVISDYDCECPAAYSWGGMCKHAVALALSYSDMSKAAPSPAAPAPTSTRASDPSMLDVFQRFSGTDRNLPANVLPGQLHIQLLFDLVHSYVNRSDIVTVEMRAGKDKLYVIKSIPLFLHSVLHGTSYTYGKNLTVFHSFEMFDPLSVRMLHILANAVRMSCGVLDTVSYTGSLSSQSRFIQLSPDQARDLIRLQAEQGQHVIFGGNKYPVVEGDPALTLHFQEVKSGTGATLTVPGILRVCPEPEGIYAYRQALYFTTREFETTALPFLHALNATSELDRDSTTFLSKQDYTRFCATVLPRLQTVMELETGSVDFSAFMPRQASFRFYLSQREDGAILLRPEVAYGDAAYPLLNPGTEYRSPEQEQPALAVVNRFFPHPAGRDSLAAIGDEEAYQLLEEGLDALRKVGDVYTEDSLRTLRWSSSTGASVGIALNGNLIDIHVEAGGMSPREINAILSAYRLKKKYYRLGSGEFLSLSEGGLSVVAELSGGLGITLDENGNAKTDAFRAQYINSVIGKEDSGLSVQRNSDFKKQIRALKNFRDSDYELPDGLQANLRSYQRAGYRWLCTLSDLGLGGILADDMGLGKTLQVLTFFLHLGGKVLVVCPASLLYNWQNECRKFTPEIETHIVRGTAQRRRAELEAETGLFITSYEQLRRDSELYQNTEFDCCVLDEAQYIRNAATKAAKAVKSVNARRRFALTGTPIENRLSDLWSIFDFLMPGYLYQYKDFKNVIELQAVEGDERAITRLTKMSAPFILRRKKQDVLHELPDKVETVLYVDMTPEQRKLYDAQEQALRLSLQNTPESEFLHQKIQYLAALTRLRQVCCTPELFLEDYSGGAAKVDACIELLKESMESGHKTLVFSQFTGMLEQLIAAAQREGIPSLYLSGRDSSEKRRDMVNSFQTGEIPVFFISLKAGGTGLNLTAADRVIHFDPWWNAAAEDQATDRTHRIGQKNTVFVTKLVCKNSVEERILDLQNRKRGLSDMVVNQESLQSAALNRDELLQLLENRVEE